MALEPVLQVQAQQVEFFGLPVQVDLPVVEPAPQQPHFVVLGVAHEQPRGVEPAEAATRVG